MPNLLKFQIILVHTTEGSVLFALGVIQSTCFRVSTYDSTTRWPAWENLSRWAVRIIAQAFSGHGKCRRGAILLHDGVRPHTALQNHKLAAKFFGSRSFGLSLSEPGFSNEPFQFVSRFEGKFVRISLKEHLSGYHRACDEDDKPAAVTSLTHQTHTFCVSGTDKHTTPSDKNLNFEGGCVEI
jgi:hypothetical protein